MKKKTFGLLAFLLCIAVIALVMYFFAFRAPVLHANSEQNILIINKKNDGNTSIIQFVHFSPSQHKLLFISLSPDISLSVIGGYGKLPLGSVFSQLSSDNKSPEFLSSAYSYGLKQIVDEVSTDPERAEELKKGNQVLTREAKNLDEWQRAIQDVRFPAQAKACSLSIINNTQIAGVGAKTAKVLEQSGIAVVRVTDEDPQLDTSQLLVNQNTTECGDIVQHIQHILPVAISPEVKADVKNLYRSDLVLLIGKDVATQVK